MVKQLNFAILLIASGHQASPLINTLISLSGVVSALNEKKFKALFDTTCVETAPYNLDNVDAITYPITDTINNTQPTLPPLIDAINEETVAGTLIDAHP